MLFFPVEAFAQGAAGAPAGGGDPLSQLLPTVLPMLAIFAVFYFFMIRPQQKRQREHQEMLKQIKKGDKVITSSGIHATVYSVEDGPTVTLQIADNTRVVFDKAVVTAVKNGN
jgi:preprotein translocase subunit YajC